MDNIFTSTTLANVFKALGAKTSDNNYAIPLFNKTSAIPQGLMDLPTLASVLGVFKIGVPLEDANEYAGSNVITFRPAMAEGSFYNYPEGSTGRLIILNMFDGYNNIQVCVIIGVDKIYTRTTLSEIWGDWK